MGNNFFELCIIYYSAVALEHSLNRVDWNWNNLHTYRYFLLSGESEMRGSL